MDDVKLTKVKIKYEQFIELPVGVVIQVDDNIYLVNDEGLNILIQMTSRNNDIVTIIKKDIEC